MRHETLKLGLIALVFIVLGVGAACSTAPSRIEIKSSGFTNWEVIQSPTTGKCYEILALNLGYSSAVMTATEVDCKFLKD